MNPAPVDTFDLSGVDQDKLQVLVAYLAEKRQEMLYNRIQFFEPNQAQRRFFKAGKEFPERLASWANGLGKTWAACAELTYHCTGEYPDWWHGRVFDSPVTCLILGLTYKQIRDSTQRILTDEYRYGLGTGTIPRDSIINYKWNKDDNECLDYIEVRHTPSGLQSRIQFFTQKQSWENLMGSRFHICLADEQVYDIAYYSQFLRATKFYNGLIILTATPEKGWTPIYDRFEKEGRPECYIQYSSLYEADHMTKEAIEAVIASYPEREKPFRVYGKPVMGAGLVYDVDLRDVFCEPFEIPSFWKRIAGIDFGRVNSKTALVWIAQDPLTEVFYVYNAIAKRGVGPEGMVPIYTVQCSRDGFRVPVAWPKDGNVTEQSTANRVRQVYEDLGMLMTEECAGLKYQDEKGNEKKSFSVQEGCREIEMLMNAGRFKIFDMTATGEIKSEMQSYAFDENFEIPKKPQNDPHSLDAMRYAFCLFRDHARAGERYRHAVKGIERSKGIFV